MRTEPPDPSDDEVQFLHDLVDENDSIAGDVVQVEENLWAIHGFVPFEGDMVMGEFNSYEEAAKVLGQISPRSRRRDDA